MKIQVTCLVVFFFVICAEASLSRHKLARAVDEHSSLDGHHVREHKTDDWLLGLGKHANADDLVSGIEKQLTRGKLALRRTLDFVTGPIVVIDASDNVDHDEMSIILLSESQRSDPVVLWFHRDGGSGRRHHN